MNIGQQIVTVKAVAKQGRKGEHDHGHRQKDRPEASQGFLERRLDPGRPWSSAVGSMPEDSPIMAVAVHNNSVSINTEII